MPLLLHRYLLAAATAEHDEQQALCDDTHMSGFRSTLMQVLEAVSQVSRTACGLFFVPVWLKLYQLAPTDVNARYGVDLWAAQADG